MVALKPTVFFYLKGLWDNISYSPFFVRAMKIGNFQFIKFCHNTRISDKKRGFSYKRT
ncbi:Uncharacterized protein dnm_039840 [Desulfonema magnum]|uniref:Uncharacterized protein n=1 Tax=Desulfonema magnum TaxID=45655 RepID=A0A975GNM8_9BACT|nr:Uncharacterized protein dnm_039840 [Desulfonema magnum]